MTVKKYKTTSVNIPKGTHAKIKWYSTLLGKNQQETIKHLIDAGIESDRYRLKCLLEMKIKKLDSQIFKDELEEEV